MRLLSQQRLSNLVLFCAIVLTSFAQSTDVAPTQERVAEIRDILPELPVFCGPSREDRDAWGQFGLRFGAEIISSAERIRRSPPPALLAESFLEYSRTGKRGGEYEKNRNQRRSRLRTLALAECIQNDRTFVPALSIELEAILSEITWVDPAHDNGLRNYKGQRIDVDLMAADAAAVVGTTLALVGDKLSEQLQDRVQAELHRRIFTPYLAFLRGDYPADYWNSSFIRSWVTAKHNWNAVCHAGISIAALSALPDRLTRATIVAGAEKNLRHYRDGFSSSGYCVEGIVYWNYGFGHYVILAETLFRESGGKIDFFAQSPIREIAAFPQNIEISPGTYPHFGDSNIKGKPMPWIQRLVNPRVGLPPPPAAYLAEEKGPGMYLYAIGLTAFPHPALVQTAAPAFDSALASPLRGWFAEDAILVARPGDNQLNRLAVAIKGGRGGLPHGHADLGQFIVALAGRTPLLDPGAEKYEAKTFSNTRFFIPRIGSFGHSVPLIAGRWQLGDARASSHVVRTVFTPDADILALDLKGAYDVPELTRLERVFTYDRANPGRLIVEDTVEFSSPQTFGTALITMGSMAPKTRDSIIVSDGNAQLLVKMETGAPGQMFTVEPQSIETNHPPAPLRIGITLNEPVTHAVLRCTITPLPTSE